jgi:ribosomal protein S18 acetylase RimI-like enzyme
MIALRLATADDSDSIAEVHVASWRTTYAGVVDQSYLDALSVGDRAAAWKRRLATSDPSAPDVLVAEDQHRGVVGFISGGAIRDVIPGFDAELHAIYLLQSNQREGLGRRLAREWAALAIDRGFRAAVVRVLAQNPACAFYERLGATVLEEGTHAVGDKSYPDRVYGWRDIRVLL